MGTLSIERLERFRCRYETLVASGEDIGMKRARADGQLSLLLQEVSEALPEEQQHMLEAILALHEALWSSAPAPRGCEALDDCRLHTPNSVIFRTVYLDQGDAAVGTVLLHGERVRVFVVPQTDGQEWTTTQRDAAYLSARMQRRGG